MSEGTFYVWKAKYSGMTVSEAKRLKALEDENTKLKKLLDMAAMKELLSKMYGPPRYCKVFVGDAPACVNVSGL